MAYDNELLVGWQNDVDPATLSTEQRNAYNEMRDYNRKASEARARFEGLVQSQLPAGCHAVFNYRFGKLSMAVAEGSKADKAKPAANSGKTLAAFLEAAKAAGRNS